MDRLPWVAAGPFCCQIAAPSSVGSALAASAEAAAFAASVEGVKAEGNPFLVENRSCTAAELRALAACLHWHSVVAVAASCLGRPPHHRAYDLT